jgi:hypothetical protein
LNREIIVHSLDQASAALGAAAALEVPVRLASAPGAGAYAGPAWFKALIAAASAAHPAVALTAIVDCGEEPGTVLAALRVGLKHIRFAGQAEARAKLAALARAQGAVLEEAAPDAVLDLGAARDPAAACRAFLGAG